MCDVIHDSFWRDMGECEMWLNSVNIAGDAQRQVVASYLRRH